MHWRRSWTLRRSRYCTAPLLLLGIAGCLYYQMLVVGRTRLKSDDLSRQENKSVMTLLDQRLILKDTERLISALEDFRVGKTSSKRLVGLAILLTGQLVSTATEVQLYQRVLQQYGFLVDLARYAETSNTLRQDKRDGSGWNLLMCLRGSARGCLRKINFSTLQPNQRVNIIPSLVTAFSEVGGLCRFQMDKQLAELKLPMIPSACEDQEVPQQSSLSSPEDDWHFSTNGQTVATVTLYVLVSSVRPLSAFLHHTGLIRSQGDKYSHVAEIQSFFKGRIGEVQTKELMADMRRVVTEVLLAATVANQEASSQDRCTLCFQWLTFTLSCNASLSTTVVKVQTDLAIQGIKDPHFYGQIRKEVLLEDGLHFLFQAYRTQQNAIRLVEPVHLGHQYGGCQWTNSLCLNPDELLLLLQFYQQLSLSSPFDVLHPLLPGPSSPSQQQVIQRLQHLEESGKHSVLSAIFQQLLRYHMKADVYSENPPKSLLQLRSGQFSQDQTTGRCVDPHLRQIYTDPPLVLTPPFDPWLKEYQAEVPFDAVVLRVRPEPVSPHCHVHLDERRGPRIVNYPVGLGNSRINILVMDESDSKPVVMTIYTLHIFRENRPSLPMFAEYVMCGFVQDCGLVVRPDQPCGLEPVSGMKISGKTQASDQPACTSGDMPGRWVLPCLSCSDNRTCDWREVAWQPDECYHPIVDRPQLQQCMLDRKVLFLGDSTNRGMMYYMMERLNGTLADWDKAHDTVAYGNLNGGSTLVSYTYYPQFWLEPGRRPTFQTALLQLLNRSRPLKNSAQTVLVVGGVHWLNINHLRTIQNVLEREGLQGILVVVKSLGMGFHLAVDGIRSLSLARLQELDLVNRQLLAEARRMAYEVVDTFSITMGRHKEFLQGRCACHFHEVAKPSLSAPQHSTLWILGLDDDPGALMVSSPVPGVSPESPLAQHQQLQEQGEPRVPSNGSYHVRGPVNRVYSDILLSRLCAHHGTRTHTHQS